MATCNSADSILEAAADIKENGLKIDKFTNGTSTETVQLGSGEPTPTLRNVVRQIFSAAAEIDNTDVSGKTVVASFSNTYRTLAARFSDVINVMDYGAVGDGVTDDSDAFEAAKAVSLETGKPLFAAGTFYLARTVDLRYVNLLFASATILLPSENSFLIIGGNANSANPAQEIRRVKLANSNTASGPLVRIIGATSQNITIDWCPYIQIYADKSSSDESTRLRDGFTAYSNFYFLSVGTLKLTGVGTGWINENQFYLNKTSHIRLEGSYGHNHNKFYNGTMEGIGSIWIEKGTFNYFYGLRFERSYSASPDQTLSIYFGQGTRGNAVEASFYQTHSFINAPDNYNDFRVSELISVEDLGRGNSVYHKQEQITDDAVLVDLSPSTPFISTYGKGQIDGMIYSCDIEGFGNLKHNIDGTFKILSNYTTIFNKNRNLIEFDVGDVYVLLSDVALFRPAIWFFDADKKLIRTEISGVLPSGYSFNSSRCGYYLSVSTGGHKIIFSQVEGVSDIKYIAIAITAGEAARNETFSFLRLVGRFSKKLTNFPRPYLDAFGEKSRLGALVYYNDSDIDMCEVAQGLPCFRYNMKEMKYNAVRTTFFATSVSGSVIGTDVVIPAYRSSGTVLYMDSNGDEVQLPVASTALNAVTLESAIPADLTVGTRCVYVLTLSGPVGPVT